MMSLFELGYVMICFIALYGYWTQITAIFRKGSMLKSASLKTYALWTGTTLVTVLYAFFENGDMLFIAVSICNFIGCLLCALSIFYCRRKLAMPVFLKDKEALNPFAGKS